MSVNEFINKAEFDKDGGGYIWGIQKDNTIQMIAEVRGWGAIQNLFQKMEDAAKFQDELGKFICDAINEKISKGLESIK